MFSTSASWQRERHCLFFPEYDSRPHHRTQNNTNDVFYFRWPGLDHEVNKKALPWDSPSILVPLSLLLFALLPRNAFISIRSSWWFRREEFFMRRRTQSDFCWPNNSDKLLDLIVQLVHLFLMDKPYQADSPLHRSSLSRINLDSAVLSLIAGKYREFLQW